MDYDLLQATSLPIPSEYYTARRRYASAVRRGDLKAADAWLRIAERELALTERYVRAEQRHETHNLRFSGKPEQR